MENALTDGLPLELPDLDTLIDANAEFDAKSKPFARTHRQPNTKTVSLDYRKIQVAADTIKRMPKEREYIHLIVSQSFAGFDLLPAFLKITKAPRYESLYLTTLGFSRDNLAQLEFMIKAGQIIPAALKILAGDFFRRADSGLWDVGMLLACVHGFGFRSYRNHTKLILARITKQFYVVESSANLRSCQNIENFTVTNNRDLFTFHANWIDEIWPKAKS